jgi:hypothetical protein
MPVAPHKVTRISSVLNLMAVSLTLLLLLPLPLLLLAVLQVPAILASATQATSHTLAVSCLPLRARSLQRKQMMLPSWHH